MQQRFVDMLSSGNSIVFLPGNLILDVGVYLHLFRGINAIPCCNANDQELALRCWNVLIGGEGPVVMLVKQGLYAHGVRFDRCDQIMWVGEEGLGDQYATCMQSLNRGQPETIKYVVPLREFVS